MRLVCLLANQHERFTWKDTFSVLQGSADAEALIRWGGKYSIFWLLTFSVIFLPIFMDVFLRHSVCTSYHLFVCGLHIFTTLHGMQTNVWLNFGFGFSAERVDFNTFGILSFSAESSHDTFGNISASAAVTLNFGGHRKQGRSSDTVSTAAKSLLHGLNTHPRSWRRPSYRSYQVNGMQTGKATCWARTPKNCFSCHTT